MTEQSHHHKHHHVASSHHKEGAYTGQYQQPLMPLSESNKIISSYPGAHDKWVGETYYNKYLRGNTGNTEVQKPSHPYLDTAVHYAPEIFAGSGITIAGIAAIVMIRRLVAKVKEFFGRRSKIVVKAPIKAKGEGKDFRVRTNYPNSIIPVYGIKEKATRKDSDDSERGKKQYEDVKKVLRVSRQERCQCCGLMFPHNEFHHLNDNHKDHRPENLALLCRYCHMQYHVDVAIPEGGRTAYFPDFSMAELSHLQQYADHIEWEKKNGVKNDSAHWHYYDEIKKALDDRCSFTMGIIKTKSIVKIIKLDQMAVRKEKFKSTKQEQESLQRFHAIRKGLKIVYPVQSAKNNGNRSNGAEYKYKDAAYKFMNGDYSSFPPGKLDELVSRLKKAPPIPESIKRHVDSMRENPYDVA